MAKSVVKPYFSLHPLPVIPPPKPPFFVRSSHFWGKIHLFRGVFLFSSREILAPNLILRRKNQFDGEFFRPKYPKFDFCRRGKRGSRRLSSPYHRRRNIKTRKVLPKNKHKDEKTQDHHEKDKGQNQKASVLHRRDRAQASKRNCFSLPPPLRSKNTCRLSLKTSPLFATSSLVSLKTSLPHTNSPSLLRAGHAPTRIYAPAHSANFPFLPSPFTSPGNKL